MLIEYVNTSSTDQPAPLLQLTATNAELRLEESAGAPLEAADLRLGPDGAAA